MPSSTRSPWSGVELLERALGYARGSLALVTPALLSAPTPCEGWDLQTLLVHMHDSLTSLHEAGSVRRVRVGVPTPAPVDLVEALRTRACQLLAEWSAHADGVGQAPRTAPPWEVLVDDRPLTPGVLTAAGALEVTVHGWDVAAACGARRPIPPALASDLMRVAPVLVSDADRPVRFGPALPSPPDATPERRLLAFLGRRC